MSVTGADLVVDAATDLTIGFGASSLLKPDGPTDPWYARSFVTICDAAINYATLTYPLPTHDGAYDHPSVLPGS